MKRIVGLFCLPLFGGILLSPTLFAETDSLHHILPHRQEVPLSPRTSLGRKNLQYEFDLHPANAFQHLEAIEKQEKKFKLRRRIRIFRDNIIFEDDL